MTAEGSRLEEIIKALLFTMGRALTVQEIAAASGASAEDVQKTARDLSRRSVQEHRGVIIIELDGAFQMCTNPQMYDQINALLHQPKKLSLTSVMMETLAIIAYRQPVTRAEIEQIRGVSCSHPINRLLEYGLIEETGRLEAPGRPILFGTTQEFLRCFGVRNLDGLPAVSPEEMEEFASDAEKEADIKMEV